MDVLNFNWKIIVYDKKMILSEELLSNLGYQTIILIIILLTF